MKYLYYPGCSLKGSGRPYEESLLEVFRKMELLTTELPDWNCCGATAYMAIDKNNAFALAARNLALAEQSNSTKAVQVIAPCNACYLVLLKAQMAVRGRTETGVAITNGLKQVGLEYTGKAEVRHPLDVFTNDVGLDKLKALSSRPLKGVKVACYYGCQVVRPYATFDNQQNPMTMDNILRAMGAETVDWPLKAQCCGGTLTGTIEEAGQRMSYIILKEARRRGADVVATACPLCQFNLECYQKQMSATFKDPVSLPVMYFSQLMGQAMGIDDKKLGINRLLVQPAARACCAA